MAKAAARKATAKPESRAIEGKWINDLLGGNARASSGVIVNGHTALTCSPVWQAVDVITADISRMPFLTYRTTADGRGKERATDHPTYKILRRSIGEMTANLWLSRILGHALLYGNGYSRVIWRGSRVVGMEWLHVDSVQRWRDGREDYYLVRYPMHRGGGVVRVALEDMFHLVGLTVDDLGGLSLVDYARNAIGRQMSAEHYADDFLANDATPSGFFTHPGEMSEQAQQRFLNRFTQSHQGVGNRWKVGILEEDMKWQSAGITPQDAMLVDQLKLGVSDVARFFNLPPHKLGDASRAAYNTLESEEKAYQSGSLGKWTSRLEFEATDKLLLDSEVDAGYFCEFLQDSHNKADTASRYQAYSIAIQWGIMSRNEVRAKENLNPYEGGDEYLTPLTHSRPSDAIVEDEDIEDEPSELEADEQEPVPQATRTAVAIRDVLAAKLDDAARLLANAATRAASKPERFLAAVNGLNRHTVAMRGMTTAAVEATQSFTGRAAGDVVEAILREATDRLLEAAECQPEELVGRVADAGSALRAWAAELATSLVFGDLS